MNIYKTEDMMIKQSIRIISPLFSDSIMKRTASFTSNMKGNLLPITNLMATKAGKYNFYKYDKSSPTVAKTKT